MERFSWGAIVVGAAVAVVINFVAGLVRSFLGESDEISITLTVGIAVVGLVAYAVGGFVAGRMAGGYGGINGLAAVVAGFVLGLILDFIVGIFTVTGAETTNINASSVDVQAAAIAGAIAIGSFLLNFLVGYLAGKLGGRTGGTSRAA